MKSFINQVNNNGQTAIHLAVLNYKKFNSLDRIREIIFKGADLDKLKDHNGSSVFELVAEIPDDDEETKDKFNELMVN